MSRGAGCRWLRIRTVMSAIVVLTATVAAAGAVLLAGVGVPQVLGVAGAGIVLYGSVVLVVDVIHARRGHRRHVPLWDF